MIVATPRFDGRTERHEFHFAQPRERMLDERKLEMGVGARVAVTRKVLSASGDTSACSPRTMAAPSRATSAAFSASARSPMTGFFGFVWTSSTGA